MSDVAKKWDRTTIKGVAVAIVGGGTPSREVPQYWGGGIPWVTPGELTGLQDKYLRETADTITNVGLARSGARLIPENSLLVTTRATLGLVALTRGPMTTNQGFKTIVFSGQAHPDFYYHLLATLKREMVRRASGTTFLEVSGSQFGQIEVPLPPLGEQRRIARILDELDSQIRAAELFTKKLGRIESAILEDLLNNLPNESNVRLKEHLLAPPKNGYSPVAASGSTGEYMLGLSCLTPRGFVPRQLKHAPLGDLRLQPFRLRDGDVLISRSNTRDLVGLAGVFRDVSAPCYYPDLMMRLVPSVTVSGTYLATVLNTQRARRQIMNFASGTSGSMVKITKSTVEGLILPIPSRSEQDRIEAATRAATAAVDSESYRLEKLRLLKAGLLADLLTGRVRVPTTEVAS